MALINIADETRDRINNLIQTEREANPHLKVTQSYIVEKAIKLMEDSKWMKNK